MTKYKNLDVIVDSLTQQFLIAINHAAVKVDQPEMPYKAQYILEEVIKKLQERV